MILCLIFYMGPQVDPNTVSRPKADAWNKTGHSAWGRAVSETRDGLLDGDVTEDTQPITKDLEPTLHWPLQGSSGFLSHVQSPRPSNVTRLFWSDRQVRLALWNLSSTINEEYGTRSPWVNTEATIGERTFVPSTSEDRCAEQFGLVHRLSQSPTVCPHALLHVQLPFPLGGELDWHTQKKASMDWRLAGSSNSWLDAHQSCSGSLSGNLRQLWGKGWDISIFLKNTKRRKKVWDGIRSEKMSLIIGDGFMGVRRLFYFCVC